LFLEKIESPAGLVDQFSPGIVVDGEVVGYANASAIKAPIYDKVLERFVMCCFLGGPGQPGWAEKTRVEVEADYPGDPNLARFHTDHPQEP